MSARYLRRDGLRVRLVTTPEQALAELTGGPDAAAVLDLTMPGLDPRRIRRALRTPVIFLVAGPGAPSARPGPQRRDDRPAAVAGPALRPPPAGRHGPRRAGRARAVAVWAPERGTEPEPGRPAGTGGLWLDGRTLRVRTAVAGGQPVKLTATEFAVLAALLDHPGRVLSRRQLLAAAGHPAAADRAADVYISQLRAKIGPAARDQDGPRRRLRHRSMTKTAPARFQGGSHGGTWVAGLPSVAQQYRFEGTSEPRECARRDPRRRACRSRRTAAARLS